MIKEADWFDYAYLSDNAKEEKVVLFCSKTNPYDTKLYMYILEDNYERSQILSQELRQKTKANSGKDVANFFSYFEIIPNQ